MTARELTIVAAVLEYLHVLDRGQATESQIHAECGHLSPPPSVAELRHAVEYCDTQGWVTGVPSRFAGKMKWNITDAGEGARLELSE